MGEQGGARPGSPREICICGLDVGRGQGLLPCFWLKPGGLLALCLQIMKEEKGYSPARWFRVVAMANSYQVRPHHA